MTDSSFHDFCRDQIGRLGSCAKFPDVDSVIGRAAVKELIDTLEFRVSRGDRQFARRVIDVLRESSRFCPSPADLISIGVELRDRENTGPKFGFAGCEVCDFSGWRAAKDRAGNDCSVPCECRRAVCVLPAIKEQGRVMDRLEQLRQYEAEAKQHGKGDSRMRQAGER